MTLVGIALGARYLAYLFTGDGGDHVQSLILAALCIPLGGLSFMIGLLADLIATNRKLLEQADFRIQRLEQSLCAQHPSILNGPTEQRPAQAL